MEDARVDMERVPDGREDLEGEEEVDPQLEALRVRVGERVKEGEGVAEREGLEALEEGERRGDRVTVGLELRLVLGLAEKRVLALASTESETLPLGVNVPDLLAPLLG